MYIYIEISLNEDFSEFSPFWTILEKIIFVQVYETFVLDR